MKQLPDLLPEQWRWVTIAVGGIAAYAGFLAVLKGMLPDLSRNELLWLYAVLTSVIVVICVVCLLVLSIRKSLGAREERGNLTKILIAWILSGPMAILLFVALMSPSPLICVWEQVKVRAQHPSITLKVQYEDNRTQLLSKGQPVVIKPGQRITLTVELPFLCEDIRNDFAFLATSKFGDLKSSSAGKFEYTSPTDSSVDFIIIHVTNKRSGQRLQQPFNVVIQERSS